MRGTQRRRILTIHDAGLIPTYAGNTEPPSPYRHKSGAHPHVCGEHAKADCADFNASGSSPRMRGTLPAQRVDDRRAGLIPTYAGNTRAIWRWRARARAHPHVCGEHYHRHPGVVFIWGSSPRMRGTLINPPLDTLLPGLIPTYAGNTLHSVRCSRTIWAHPHVCGEHLAPHPFGTTRLGSSPRMRGTPKISVQ